MPGLFRAGLATILLGDALLAIPDVDAFYGAQGVWPTSLATGLLQYCSATTLHGVWFAGCAALLCLALGLFTRLAAALSWAFLVTVHERNTGITTGGDYLAQILLFFCMFLDCGAAFSLDARLRGRAKSFIAAAPWRAMQLHLATLYFVTTRLKLRGGWLSGDGIYLSLQHLGFLRPLGAFLLEHPSLCKLSTWAVLTLEGAFALFALSPFYGRNSRLIAVLCASLVQLGVLSLMRVGMFTPLMLWTNLLFLPAEPRAVAPSALVRRWSMVAACNLVIVLLAWDVFVGKRWPMPLAIVRIERALGLSQPFDLFGATYEVAEWHASGVRTNGGAVDLLADEQPGFRSDVGWRYSSYYKLTFASRVDHAAIARFLCNVYTQHHAGDELRAIRLWKHARQPVLPGQNRPFEDVTLYEGACPSSASPAAPSARVEVEPR